MPHSPDPSEGTRYYAVMPASQAGEQLSAVRGYVGFIRGKIVDGVILIKANGGKCSTFHFRGVQMRAAKSALIRARLCVRDLGVINRRNITRRAMDANGDGYLQHRFVLRIWASEPASSQDATGLRHSSRCRSIFEWHNAGFVVRLCVEIFLEWRADLKPF